MRMKNETKTMTYADKFATLAAGTDFRASNDGTQVFEDFRRAIAQCKVVCIPQDVAMYLARTLVYLCEYEAQANMPMPQLTEAQKYMQMLQSDASKINKADTIHLLDELANCWQQIKKSTYTYRFLCVLAQCVM